MQYIITALKSEAKPIIDYYGLKFSGLSNFPLYKNDNLLCSLQELAEKMSPTFSICFFKKIKLQKIIL